jgi:hypothetical protein
MRRLIATVSISVVLLLIAATMSYRRASATAAITLCPMPAGTKLIRARLSPWRPPGQDLRPTWIFTYGPTDTPGHEAFQLFITPSGRLTRSNPPDLLARLATMPNQGAVSCVGTA